MSEFSTKFLYTNYKGVEGIRDIDLDNSYLYFGSNEWHPVKQWLLAAYDNEKKSLRTFSLKDCDFTKGS